MPPDVNAPAQTTQSSDKTPQVKYNYLNVCTPTDAEQQQLKAALTRLPAAPKYNADFEISRGRTSLQNAEPARYLRLRRELTNSTEFNNVQFSPTAAATFTMVTNGLRWGGTLTLNNNATLSTGNLALTGPGGNLTVNNGATLTAGTSVVSATNVTMTGGTSGAITASGSWTVSGNWDTSGAGSVLTAALSTVTLSGTAKTVRILNASNGLSFSTPRHSRCQGENDSPSC